MAGLKLITDPNEKAPCTLCGLMHVVTQRCNYDVLVTRIHDLKGQIQNLIDMNKKMSKANIKLYEEATKFQNVIKTCERELERLYPIEARYKKWESENGSEKLQTNTQN